MQTKNLFKKAMITMCSAVMLMGISAIGVNAAEVTAGDFTISRSKPSYSSPYVVSVSAYTGQGGAITLPKSANINDEEYLITSVGAAFTGNVKITDVTIPEGYDTIDVSAFEGCTNLKSVTIPGSMTMISAYAFKDCPNLETITFADDTASSLSVKNDIFANCTSLTSINLPKRLSSATEAAFAGAEFGVKPSQSDVKFSSLTLSDELKNESKVQTIKDGCLYFGFFSNTNKYNAGNQKIATLNYSYSGSAERTVSLVESKIVTVDENNKTIGDTSSKPFTITITRSGGGSSSGGGSGSGGIKKPDITLPDISKPYLDKSFTDVEGHWAENDIYNGVENGLFTGVSDTLFEPEGTVTRAMAVTVLGRFSKDSIINSKSVFTDVPTDKYYANYVSWGAENSIAKGINTSEFAPENSVTREQISAMIVRYLNYKDITLPNASTAIKNHSDYERISDYAKEGMAICYEMGLIKDHDNGLIDPQGNLTRAQLASVMARLADYIEDMR